MKQYEAAYDDWLSGMKYGDIADKYGVSESTVKSWAARYWKKKSTETTEKVAKSPEKDVGQVAKNSKKDTSQVAKKPSKKVAAAKEKPAKSRGAPKGNQNAKGNSGGAPKGNQNALKHGLRAKVYWDVLTDEEIDLLQEMELSNEEALLEEQIMIFTLRERRLLKTIAEFKTARGGLTIDSVVKRQLEIQGNFLNSNTDKQTQSETTTKTVATFDVIIKLEAELTRVQAKKTKAIEDLAKLRLAMKKEVSDTQKQLVDDWVAALLDGDTD